MGAFAGRRAPGGRNDSSGINVTTCDVLIMLLIPLILDSDVSYGRGSGGSVSLLSLPLGTGTVLEHLIHRVEKLGHTEVLLLSSHFRDDGDLPRGVQGGPVCVRVVRHESLSQELDRYETSDYLLVIDPRLWPVGEHDFSDCQVLVESYRGATHVIAVGANGEGARERVECDGLGHVRRVQRLYAAKNYSEAGGSTITHSLVPARATMGCRFSVPVELRAGLSATGVLSQDLPRNVDVLRLTRQADYLALTERTVGRLCREPGVAGFQRRGPEILVGRDCRIHPSARLVGPLIIQPGAVLEEATTVIGPSVVGAGSRVLRGACVIQSALVAGSVLAEGAIARHVVVTGHGTAESLNEYVRPVLAPTIPVSSVGQIHHRGGRPAWQSVGPDRGRSFHFAVKRALDILLSAAALIVLAPLLLVVAVLIKLDSPGPVFFSHRREGRKGREFPCWKFRTMVKDAHRRQRALYKQSEVDGPQFKIREDPRVTRVGRWLRGTNVDELPQLINVFLGHMSLVGPRPSPFRENQICIPWRRARLSVRPGITGLWQVCRDQNRHMGDFHEWIFYDMTYVRHFSIWLDVKILIATLITMGGRWSVPLSWVLPHVGREVDSDRYSVSFA
ncbi:MAG: sugar transferase [Phycisphaerae bacterium]